MEVTDTAERLGTILRSLPEPGLRVAFLRDYIADGDDAKRARALDGLCEAGARATPAARGPMLAVVMLFAQMGDHPVLDRLGARAVALGLVSLGRLLRRAPQLSEPEGVARVPDYGAGRELSLGERKSLARRPNRAKLDRLLSDPHPAVIAQLLQNPRLTEDDLVRMAARRPGSAEIQRAIAQSPWLCRARVRMALIQHPVTPSSIYVPLLAACTVPELVQICDGSEPLSTLGATARELLGFRSMRPMPLELPQAGDAEGLRLHLTALNDNDREL
ncbi:MAG TPA: hypothetical protein VER33_28615 [Polyangiaceae bacterium]|nr:hypothetical protein [Polyangiaceae bacterium]